MGKMVKSARGQLIDFDLLKIKEQIAAAPPSVDVLQRQDFVERRLRRRVKKKPIVETGGEVEVNPDLPGTDDSIVDLIKEEPEEKTKTTRQKTKPKSTKQPARKTSTDE